VLNKAHLKKSKKIPPFVKICVSMYPNPDWESNPGRPNGYKKGERRKFHASCDER
jgi:hypothetical protein